MKTRLLTKRAPGFKPNANQRYIGRGSLFRNPFTRLPLNRTKEQFQVKTEEKSVVRFGSWFRERLARDLNLQQTRDRPAEEVHDLVSVPKTSCSLQKRITHVIRHTSSSFCPQLH